MNKKKEIEAMAKVIARTICSNYDNCKADKSTCGSEYDAEHCCAHTIRPIVVSLIDAGFGNVNKYKKEIERLETELSHREEDLIHADENVSRREWNVALAEKEIKKQAVEEFVNNVIDLFDEMGMKRSSEYNDGYDDGVADCITNIRSRLIELYGAEQK